MTYLDNHTHLDDIGLDDGPRPGGGACASGRARRRGHADPLGHGRGVFALGRGAGRAVPRRLGHRGLPPARGRRRRTPTALEVLASLDRPSQGAGLGETGLDYYRNRAPRADPGEPCSCATWSWPPRPGCPW